ncbi:MAG: diphthine synthase [Methanomicrobiales archaeon]|nr:diphthine synthase [Methanomicrobiales archaeon]
MLTFIGLGLYDWNDISVKGLEEVRKADLVLMEIYTSRLMGSSPLQIGERFGREILLLSREEIEEHPEWFLSRAVRETVVLLSAGDPMVSTTHADLRLRAASRGIETRIIHGASISSAVCGLTGLQNYRFGKSCSIPFPAPRWSPNTPMETILQNLSRDLHTLVYMDIQGKRCMTVREGLEQIGRMSEAMEAPVPELFVGVARAGSDRPVVRAGSLQDLVAFDFGPPLHALVVPASLHPIEREYLEVFAGL